MVLRSVVSRPLSAFAMVALIIALTGAAADGVNDVSGLRSTPTVAHWPQWLWPVEPPRNIVRPFIAPETPYSAGHRGIDLAVPVGSPVHATADGVVHFAGVVVDRPVLSVQHPGGLISSYEPVVSTLQAGDTVRADDLLGTVEASEHCPAACLHFGVRLHGQYVSPLNYLGGIPRSVLLPTRPLR